MDLILLERIQNLGELGDIVSVKSGYGRNFLIPQGKAVPASSDAKEKVEARRRELAQLDSERLDAAKAKAALLPERLTVKRLAGEEGKLFGSVTPGISRNCCKRPKFRASGLRFRCRMVHSKPLVNIA